MLTKKFSLITITFFLISIMSVNSYAFEFTSADKLPNTYKVEQLYNADGSACENCFKAILDGYNSAACKYDNKSCNCSKKANACLTFGITNLLTNEFCILTIAADSPVVIQSGNVKPGICNIPDAFTNCVSIQQGSCGGGTSY